MFAVAPKCWFSILQNGPDKEDYDVQEYSIQTTLNNYYCFDLFCIRVDVKMWEKYSEPIL